MLSITNLIEENKTAEELSVFIKTQDEINKLDGYRKSPLFSLEDNDIEAIMEQTYTNAFLWTKDQRRARMQGMLLLDSIDLDLNLLPDQPDSEAWIGKYKKFTTATIQIEAIYLEMMLVTMTRQVLNAPVIAANPHIRSLIQKKDSRKKIETAMAHELGKGLFGPNDRENMPMIALPKMIEMTSRWDRNRHAIDKGPEQLAEFTIENVISGPIKAKNGLWIVPIQNYDELQKEAEALKSCLWGHRMVCMFEGLNVISIRRDINVPGFTAGIIPDPQGKDFIEYRPPSGIEESGPQVKEAWDNFKQDVSNGKFGKPCELIAFSMNKIDMLENRIDVPSVLAGYDINSPDAMENADKMWSLWAQKMDDLLRYRKLNLEDMLEKSDLSKRLNQAVSKFALNPVHTT